MQISSVLKQVTHITKYLHGSKSFLKSHQLLSYTRISQYFIDPEGSLPGSQEPTTSPYPEPDESSPYHSILLL
jgi:hypothetical protein